MRHISFFTFPEVPPLPFLSSLLLPNLSQDYRYSAGIFLETIEKQIVYHPTGIPSHFASLPRVLQKCLHLSSRIPTFCHTTRYKMKDVSGIFQLPFIAESEKVLRRMMFQSQPNDFPISAERFSNHSRTK